MDEYRDERKRCENIVGGENNAPCCGQAWVPKGMDAAKCGVPVMVYRGDDSSVEVTFSADILRALSDMRKGSKEASEHLARIATALENIVCMGSRVAKAGSAAFSRFDKRVMSTQAQALKKKMARTDDGAGHDDEVSHKAWGPRDMDKV